MDRVSKLITAVMVTILFLVPIILSIYPISNAQALTNGLAVIVAALSISALVTWRSGTTSGVSWAVIMVIATVLLPTQPPMDNLVNYVFLLIALALGAGSIPFWIKSVLILLVGSLSYLFSRDLRTSLIVSGSGLIFIGIFLSIKLVGIQSQKIFASIRGYWSPILAYLVLSGGTITIFALWYQFAFINWGNTAFDMGVLFNELTEATWPQTFFVFLYQSILTFATVGPPFPPNSNYARLLVGLELISSIILAGIYLGLLFHHLSKTKEDA